MNHPLHVCVVMGTRPEVIKCWPVILRLQADSAFRVSTFLTGQHRELIDPVIRRLGVPVTKRLDVMRPSQSLESLTARLIEQLGAALAERRPDVVLVQGDTTSAFAGALAAFYAGVPVGHIEAGLRTGDVRQPFPEEMNRRLVTVLAERHFAPTPAAREALLREGVSTERILVTGNTGIDALREVTANAHRFPPGPQLRALLTRIDGPIIVATVHRRENRSAMRGIAEGFRAITTAHPEAHVVLSLHASPAARNTFVETLAGQPRCHLIDALDYPDFAHLLSRGRLVVTDSGGVQEEAPFLGKPTLVLRRVTERPEAVSAGVSRVIGDDPEEMLSAVGELLRDGDAWRRMSRRISPFGDGRAAERITQALRGGAGLSGTKVVASREFTCDDVYTPPASSETAAGVKSQDPDCFAAHSAAWSGLFQRS